MKTYNKPILTRKDIPDIPGVITNAASVFNPGAVRFNDEYLLALRVQKRSRETVIMLARSKNGIDFQVDKKVIEFSGIEKVKEKIYHCYDPRLTKIDDAFYLMFAMDMDGKCSLGLAKTLNFEKFNFLGIVADGDVRNGVLFPEKINGKFMRFERPNRAALENGTVSGNSIVLSESDDLLKWTEVGVLMSGRFHYWDERIGSGPPPVKTEKGWLHIYHGIAEHFGAASIYQGGAVLLDLKNPLKIISRSMNNFIEPREIWEMAGQVPNVVFPSGMIVEEYDEKGFAKLDSHVKIYYGAADTVVGLAETTISELIEFCYD
ncbi:MAG: glycoside hydrolase family 130 protein [Candidatus Marinimicrobia bacterium]|nr:glycoside hydrolase family 130 protein [Candidatus Neomarinimicrobiota bacterium]